MTMKRVAIVLISFLVASIFAVVVSVTDPGAAQAAGGGYVEKCGGGEIFLNEKEEKINERVPGDRRGNRHRRL